MDNERLLHDLIVDLLIHRLSKDYKEIKVNPSGDPDLILSNHGLILALMEVETESSINPDRAEKWKEMFQPGSKLVLIVPKSAKMKVTELLWQNGIADKISLGTYEVVINIP